MSKGKAKICSLHSLTIKKNNSWQDNVNPLFPKKPPGAGFVVVYSFKLKLEWECL